MISAEQYDHRLQRAAQRALDTLDRVEARTERQYAAARRHERRAFRGQVELQLLEEDGTAPDGPPFRVWARSVSESGLAFIHPEWIEARHVLVHIDLGEEKVVTFRAEIVRRKSLPGEMFNEYGVAFRGRA